MADRSLANRVMYDGLFTFGMRMLNIVCAAGLGILTARLLGPAGKGIYALPIVEAGLVVTAYGGLSSAFSYFLLNRRVGRTILFPALATAGIYILVGAAVIVPLAVLTKHPQTMVPAILFLPASAAVNLTMGYVIGIKRVRYNTSVNVAVTVVSLVLMAVTLLLIARRPVAAIIVWLAANWIVGGIALALVVRHARRLSGDERVTMREFLRFGIRVGLVNLVSLLNYRADLYIVAIMTNAASLGMYTVAISAAESLLVPTQVAALVTSPHIGSLDVQEAARLTARCVRNNLLVALVVCGALFALASPLVHILYGRAFLPVVPALRILLVGVFALSLGSPMSTFFTLKLGRPDIPLRFAAMSAVICIAVAVVLVPHFGITGAAVGSTAAYIAGQSVASWWFTRSTAIGLAAMLIPTRADITLYRGFLQRVLEDGRRLVHQAPPAR